MIRKKLIYLLFIFFFQSIISKNIPELNDNHIRAMLLKNNPIKQAFFPSKHDIRKILNFFTNNEKKSIKFTSFLLTDKDITNNFIKVRNEKKVMIQGICCQSNLNLSFNKINLLTQNNIDIFVFPAAIQNKLNNAIMHNKFIIFEQNIGNKSILWTGSLNLTAKAQDKNKENVIVLEDNYLISLYNNEFEDIKKESKLIKIAKQLKN